MFIKIVYDITFADYLRLSYSCEKKRDQKSKGQKFKFIPYSNILKATKRLRY